jgi:uncharacterized protein YciI
MKKLLFIITSSMIAGLINGNAQITQDTVMNKISKGRAYTLVLLKDSLPQTSSNTDEIKKMQMDHLIHLFQMEKEGKISIFGPAVNDTRLTGIIIFNTVDQKEIKKDLEGDPYIKSGHLKYELYTWFSLPGQKLPE